MESFPFKKLMISNEIKSTDHSSWDIPPRVYRNLDLSGRLDVYHPGAFLVVLKEECCATLLAIRADIPYEGIPCPDLMTDAESLGMSALGHWAQGKGDGWTRRVHEVHLGGVCSKLCWQIMVKILESIYKAICGLRYPEYSGS
ncbi:hypothetical protein CDAR_418021 [Caerostris darwini]|uniref:Uncharacterized protein n=1 Tax=Caerostris darwini TaxID=1538125 RepID=A0AAV4NNC6_9ARAC|nr:hypothetical protein CDAR_418021 [Caerostris darwini]